MQPNSLFDFSLLLFCYDRVLAAEPILNEWPKGYQKLPGKVRLLTRPVLLPIVATLLTLLKFHIGLRTPRN